MSMTNITWVIQIDDFYTDASVIDGLQSLMGEINVSVTLFALLALSDREVLRSLKSDRVTIGVHGWNHYVESQFGYWQMRHFLETALSWNCFDRMMTMPWNRMPKLGAVKALRESGFTLVTPYRKQRVVATILGCNSVDLKPDMLLHPPDLLDSDGLEEVVEFYSDKETRDD